MADAGVIKEFLVGLGWTVDRQGQQRFDEAIAGAKTAALALGATLAGVVASVGKVAQAYEQMGYAAQRAQSSVSGMQGFAYAVSQMGGNAQSAAQSLQNMGNFLRSSPGAASFLSRLGVQAQDAHGNLRDTSAIMGDLAAKFRSMPYWQAKASAGVLGIDENTLQSMMRGLGKFWPEYQRVYKMAGISQEQAAKAGAAFMQQLRSLGIVLQALRDKVGISLMRGVGGDIARLRALVMSNFSRISGAIETAARVVLSLGEALTQLLSRGGEIMASLFDWFTHLDRGTRQWIVGLGLLAVAWKVMNTAFMATPIGRVIALGTAILALYDDYKTWQKGGEHLIPWEKWKPDIDAAMDSIAALKDILVTLWDDVKPGVMPILNFFGRELIASFRTMGTVLGATIRMVDDMLHKRWGDAKSELGNIGGAIASHEANLGSDIVGLAKSYGPRGIRNNNPGNIEYVGQSGAHSDGRFAVFNSAQAGLAAMASQLRLYINRDHIDTIRGIISKWAPASDGNATSEYIKHVSQRMGIAPDAHIDPNNVASIAGLMHAITQSENGIDPYQGSHAMIARDVIARSGATTTTNAPVTLHQNITNNISGSGNPQATGQAVADRQQDATARLTRNLKMRRG